MDQEQHQFQFSDGWYRLTPANKIKKNKIYTFNYFGTSLICIKNSENVIQVFDAFCPHLGAHLGVGGQFKNDILVCPFHGWKYNSSGKCVEIPYCQTIPKRAQLQAYPVMILQSIVYIYLNSNVIFSSYLSNKMNPQPHPAFPFTLPETFKDFLTLTINTKTLDKIIEYFRSNNDHFTLYNSGIFYTESKKNALKICLLGTATPINAQSVSLTLSWFIQPTWNIFRIVQLKRTMHAKLKLLLHS